MSIFNWLATPIEKIAPPPTAVRTIDDIERVANYCYLVTCSKGVDCWTVTLWSIKDRAHLDVKGTTLLEAFDLAYKKLRAIEAVL